jgi:glycosyltransferase involved in cell wall biosynthesis
MTELQAKKKYLWLHDILYPHMINERVIEQVDKILFLSKWHSQNVPSIPKDKIYITNNGINPDEFKNLPRKRPNSLFWGSSYDRGLLPFLKNIWPLIQKEIPDVTLDVAYGWQNIEKEMADIPSLAQLYTELSPLLESTPGVTHHGRISHKKLADLMGSCMVYPYASEFGETCNITSQKCQAAGCYVITTAEAGGTPERVLFGDVLEAFGIYTNKQAQKVFAKEVVAYLKQPVTQWPNVRKTFSWETTSNQWIKELL